MITNTIKYHEQTKNLNIYEYKIKKITLGSEMNIFIYYQSQWQIYIYI